jgi:hypothetical protein
MLDNEGAGADQDGQDRSGALSGGSSEDGSENDDKPITARQLKAALASQKQRLEEQLAAKDRELQAFKEGLGNREPAKDQPKVYTRAELKALVENGQITQEQADDRWDRQREVQLRESARKEALDAVTGHATKERIDSDIAAYVRLRPEIKEAGSELREQIREEFKYLTSIGKPADTSTELAAIRAVLGPISKLEKAASAERSQESHQESGGGGSRPKGGAGKTLAEKLNPRYREHYEKGIQQGRYKDWKDVESELKYMTPKRRQEMGLPT